MRWPWSKPEEYTDKGRFPTHTDRIGKFVEDIKETSERIESDVHKLKDLINALYERNYDLVKQLQECRDGKK